MLEVSWEPDPAVWAAATARQVDDTVEIVLSATAIEVRRAIKDRASSRWPGAAGADRSQSGRDRSTGQSLRAWRVRRRRRDIRVFNATAQGAILSDAPTIRGTRNVHYGAGQRTVVERWPQILAAAGRRAEKAAARRAARTSSGGVSQVSVGGHARSGS